MLRTPGKIKNRTLKIEGCGTQNSSRCLCLRHPPCFAVLTRQKMMAAGMSPAVYYTARVNQRYCLASRHSASQILVLLWRPWHE
jgi:hypothetical protein